LLASARRIRGECGCPIVTTLGFEVDPAGEHTTFTGTQFEERFVVTEEARTEFLAANRFLGRLAPALTDEIYDVYVLR
jgi:hypothetical protein